MASFGVNPVSPEASKSWFLRKICPSSTGSKSTSHNHCAEVLAVDYGNNVQRPYAGALPDEFTAFFQRIIPIDRQAKTAILAPGVVVPVNRPFFGVMGVAPPPAMGRISSMPPGV